MNKRTDDGSIMNIKEEGLDPAKAKDTDVKPLLIFQPLKPLCSKKLVRAQNLDLSIFKLVCTDGFVRRD